MFSLQVCGAMFSITGSRRIDICLFLRGQTGS